MVSTKSDYIHTDIQLQSEYSILNLVRIRICRPNKKKTERKTQTKNCKYSDHIETRNFKRYQKEKKNNRINLNRNAIDSRLLLHRFGLSCNVETEKKTVFLLFVGQIDPKCHIRSHKVDGDKIL